MDSVSLVIAGYRGMGLRTTISDPTDILFLSSRIGHTGPVVTATLTTQRAPITVAIGRVTFEDGTFHVRGKS